VDQEARSNAGAFWAAGDTSTGARNRLRAVEPADWETHFLWDQDSETARSLDRVHFPHSREAVKRWAERASLQEGKTTDDLEIETHAGEQVGAIGTHHCERRAGTCSYGVAIGAEHLSKGYASEAILLVLRHFFHELGDQKATAQVYSFNASSIALHERLGFQLEGRLRRMIVTHRRHFDELLFGMTCEEFEAQHLQVMRAYPDR
jgi:RimJ/RimL family protein N-acetyltransferase